MFAQVVVQRCHRRVNVGGGAPPQVPSVTDSVEPSVGVPEIAGSTVFVGATTVEAAAAIAAVCTEAAVAVPTAFRAVTTTCSFRPASAAVSRYVAAVAPVMAAHVVAVQRCHCRVRFGDGAPVQVPVVEVSVEPTFAVPVITGSSETSGAAVIAAVAADAALVLPARFAAVTTARSRRPASAATGT